MKGRWRHIFELNLATLILGSSGFLGKVIEFPAPFIIFARCIVAFFALFLLLKWKKQSIWPAFRRRKWFFIFSGLLLGVHWVMYFISIKISIVSIAVVSIFTFPAITTLLEPLFFKTRLSRLALFNSALVVAGLIILTPEFNLNNEYTVGVLLGVGSAILFAVRNLLNKKYIVETPATVIMLIQLLVSAVILSPAAFIYPIDFEWKSVIYLIALSIVTTAIGHTLFVNSLKHFKTSAASVITSLQPVYGILLAVIFLGEKLTQNVLIGGSLILASVFIESYKQYSGINK